MTLSVLAVLRQSLRRLATGPALLVLLALVVVQMVATVVPGQFVRSAPGVIGAGGGASPVVFTGNPLPVLVSLLALVLGIYLALVTIRVFAGQWGIVEREHLTRRVGFGLLNLLGIFVGLAVLTAVGRVVLVGVLGPLGVVLWLALLVALVAVSFFAPAFVAVEDDNLLTAVRKSVRVLARSPLQVVGLLVALVLVNAVLQTLGSLVVGALDSLAFLELLVLTALGAVGLVFFWITVARAYDQLGTEVRA